MPLNMKGKEKKPDQLQETSESSEMPLKLRESVELEGISSWVSESRQEWGAGRTSSSAGARWLLATASGNRIRAAAALRNCC